MSHPVPRITLQCERCGGEFKRLACQIARRPIRFCSSACRIEPRQKRTCGTCGTAFERTAAQLRADAGEFCSKRCGYIARRNRMELTCAECGVRFERKQSEIDKAVARYVTGRGPFCSKPCDLADMRRGAHSYPKRGGRHEHRIVAEQKLGRALLPGEVVHHIDGDRRNNAPENLEVLPSQAEHAREHADILAYARSRRRAVLAKRARETNGTVKASETLFA